MKLKNYVLMEKAIKAVWDERQRQNEIWGIQRHAIGEWLGILIEEVGEVGQAINKIHFPSGAKPTDADDLEKELIHVAAVALAMYEQLIDPDCKKDPVEYIKAKYMDLDD
jgi:NTP pyrophosphatase (non-canonical NTP hydrolase)